MTWTDFWSTVARDVAKAEPPNARRYPSRAIAPIGLANCLTSGIKILFLRFFFIDYLSLLLRYLTGYR